MRLSALRWAHEALPFAQARIGLAGRLRTKLSVDRNRQRRNLPSRAIVELRCEQTSMLKMRVLDRLLKRTYWRNTDVMP
jgi:hypothetical protein